jgi:hypothetical protein
VEGGGQHVGGSMLTHFVATIDRKTPTLTKKMGKYMQN